MHRRPARMDRTAHCGVTLRLMVSTAEFLGAELTAGLVKDEDQGH